MHREDIIEMHFMQPEAGHEEITKLLIEKRADVNA